MQLRKSVYNWMEGLHLEPLRKQVSADQSDLHIQPVIWKGKQEVKLESIAYSDMTFFSKECKTNEKNFKNQKYELYIISMFY